MRAHVRSWWPRLVQFALPNRCSLCGNMSHNTLCDVCDAQFWNEPRLRCTVCALPLAGKRRAAAQRYRCASCIDAPPPFDATFTLGDYRAPLDLLARHLKFRARTTLGREFGRRLAIMADDTASLEPIDVIVPVPLSRERLIERGHNQAWQIARPLAKSLAVRADAALVRRCLHTAPQSRLDLDTRRRNVEHAFTVTRDVKGWHVAVVDDVMTSGATLEALARTLKTHGARRVTNFVALRTPKN